MGGPRNGGGVTSPVRVPTHSKVGCSGGPNSNKDILRRPNSDLLIPPSSVPHSSSGSKDKPCPNGENSTHAARMARQGVCPRNSGTNSFVLFKDVYGTQTRKGDVQAHHRPLGSKFFSGGPKIQNEHYSQNSGVDLPWNVGLEDRLRQRILQRCNGPGIPQVPGLYPGGQGVRLPGSPIRASNSPVGVHQSTQTSSEVAPPGAHLYELLPGRLHSPSLLSGPGRVSHRKDCEPSPVPRVYNQLEEIGSGPKSKPDLPRGPYGPKSHGAFSASGQSGSYSRSLQTPSRDNKYLPKGPGSYIRVSQLRCEVHTPGKTLPSSIPEVDKCPHTGQLTRHSCPSDSKVTQLTPTLGEPGSSSNSGSHACQSSRINSDDRRIGVGMVRDPPPSQGGGDLGTISSLPFHELERAGDHKALPAALPPPHKGKDYKSALGQYHGSGLSQEPGLPSLHSPLAPVQKDFGKLPEVEHSSNSLSHPRGPERSSGSGLERAPNFHRMDGRSGDFQGPLRPPGHSSNRVVRHSGEQPSAQLCVSLPGQPGSGSGRNGVQLEPLAVSLPLSTHPDALGGGSEAPVVPRFRVADSATLEGRPMVPIPPPQVSQRPTSPSPTFPIAGNPQGNGLHGQGSSAGSRPSRLGIINSFLSRKGVNRSARKIFLKQHAPGSIKQYQAAWKLFLTYLSNNNIQDSQVSDATLFNFLSEEANTKYKAYRTIAAYKCALKLPLAYLFKVDTDGPLTTSFMTGLYREKPPIRGVPLPSWDLTDLLLYLKSRVFEPLEDAPLDTVLRKALVLILLATGRRLSGIANLSRSSYVKGNRIYLKWLPSFRAKNENSKFRAQFPSLCAIEGPDKSLCPVRAYKILLEKKRDAINCVNNDCLWPKNQATLSTFLVGLVADSVRHAGKIPNMPIGPHQFRKLAASLCFNFFTETNIKLLPLRMGSASLSILKRAYIRSLRRPGIACVAPLGTVPSAG